MKTMKNDITTIYLVRHGTTEWNALRRYQGQADNPLDENGERQGALLTDYFKDIDVDLGVTSPLKRAKKTLEYCLAGQKREVPVLVEPGVIEINFGTADGLTEKEIRAAYPDLHRMFIMGQDRGHVVPPGGEPMQHVYERMRDTVMGLAAQHRGQTIVIASHGTAIQTFLNYASGIPWDQIKRFQLFNVSVSCVDIDGDGKPHVRFIGDKHHIPEELQFSYGRTPGE